MSTGGAVRHDGAEAAVILCAGGSRRMGRPKGLLRLHDVPLLRAHVDALRARAARVVVVLGHEPAAHREVLPVGVEIIENAAWATSWPADSLRLAVLALDLTGPLLVTPVDVPPASPATLGALLGVGAPAVPVGPDGAPGHPVLLDAAAVSAVRARAPEGGLRALLALAPRVPVPGLDVAVDFDDPASWADYLARRRP